jgi:hypothetical protein
VETSQHLFKELENAEKLFSDGSIKNAQKIVRNVIKQSKSLTKIPNKLRHKINAAISKSKYFDEISSFATNPKRENLITKINDLTKNPNKDPKKHAHAIHDIQTQWQLLDLSSKPASKSQWLKFNELTNKAWEPCKEYFDEIKQIKINNAEQRKIIINEILIFIESNKKNWPDLRKLITYLQKTFQKWQKYAPVQNEDLDKLKNMYFEAKKPINEEIKRQEEINKELKNSLIQKVKEIQHEDNELCIQDFKKLKDQWSKIGPAGRKEEKKLWNLFNKSADRFFAEKKDKIKNEVIIIKDLNSKLKKEEISISEINESLREIIHAKNSNEYKKLQNDIKKEHNKIKLLNKESKIKSYIDLYGILNKKIDTNQAPNIFLDSIKSSYDNKESDLKELNYVCIKLEVKAGIESLKKDQEIRNQIQLELLSNKFNKSDKSNLDDLDSLIIHFIKNFSTNDVKKSHNDLWKRISKCIEALI